MPRRKKREQNLEGAEKGRYVRRFRYGKVRTRAVWVVRPQWVPVRLLTDAALEKARREGSVYGDRARVKVSVSLSPEIASLLLIFARFRRVDPNKLVDGYLQEFIEYVDKHGEPPGCGMTGYVVRRLARDIAAYLGGSEAEFDKLVQTFEKDRVYRYDLNPQLRLFE